MAYKSKFTGAQIDEYLEKAKNENLQTIGAAPARNLLHNWYFAGAEIWCKKGSKYFTGTTEIGTLSADTLTEGTLTWGNSRYDITVDGTSYTVSRLDCYQKPNTGPVNQRGAVSYSGSGCGIDRWNGYNATAKVTLTADCVIYSGNGSQIYQAIENYKDFAGKTVTLSIVADAEIGSGFFGFTVQGATLVGSGAITAKGTFDLYKVSYTLPDTIDKLWIDIGVYASQPDNTRVKVRGVGLNLGTTQTVWHKDASGNWVPNEYPDYAEELRRCQRYRQEWRYSNKNFTNAGCIAVGYAIDSTKARLMLPLQNIMRDGRPTVEFSNLKLRRTNNTEIDVTAASVLWDIIGNEAGLQCTVASGLTAKEIVFLQVNGPECLLALSREL